MTTFPPECWGTSHAPNDAAQATISKGAPGASHRHVVTSITCTLEGAANAAAITFVLRDSTTGTGNILWQGKLANPVDQSKEITLDSLAIRGEPGQAVTLESTGAPAASSSVTVAMTGYTRHDP